ncbi:MAG: zinc ribbon domain-containing protein [Treponema sp.]|nr:zinc ribbon domain-containing protein [Treponema sp.]
MFCGKCGKQLEDGATVCPECGTTVENEETVSVVKVEEVKTESEEKGKKGFTFDWWEAILSVAIFTYNMYAITYNLITHTGYVHVVIGIAINIGIICSVPKMVKDLLSRNAPQKLKELMLRVKKPVLLSVVYVPFFIIGIVLGYNSVRWTLEKESVELVSKIAHNMYGSNAAKCRKVKIDENLGNNLYNGTAYLDNGNEIDICISYYPEDDKIEVSLAD